MIRWNAAKYAVSHSWCQPVSAGNLNPYPYPDMALIDVNVDDHPWVDCETGEPSLYPKPDQLHCVGWTGAFSRDMPRLTPVSLKYEGSFADSDDEADWRLQLREGQISAGMSGAPILNQRTGRVCAMMTRTRDSRADMGGWAVPIAKHFNRFPEVRDRIATSVSGRWTKSRQADLFRRFNSAIRPAHRPLPVREQLPPSLLLRTEYAVVPFLGRQDEINGLVDWCESGEQSAMRLLVGPAGAGKTRLAAQLCVEMSSRGWTAGFLSQGCRPESFDELRETGNPLLATLDYGDAWLELEQFLIRLDAPAETAPPTRILLLARHSGGWWNRLVTANPYVAMDAADIRPTTVSQEGLRAMYLDSAEAFRQHLGAAALDPNEEIPALAGQPILVVHMAALLRIDAPANKTWQMKGRTIGSPSSAIVASILAHEEGYWRRSVAATRTEASDVVLRRVVSLAGLFGWGDEADLASLLTAVPDLADASSERRHALARWVMAFYAVDDPRQQEILQPDLLAEQLVACALVDCLQLLLTALDNVEPDRADRAFAMIDRACREHNPLRWMLEKALRTGLHRLGPMILRVGERSEGPLREEFMRAVRVAETDFQTLEDLLGKIPANSVLLQDAAITMCQRAVGMARMEGDAMVEAAMLERLASRLDTTGHKDEAADLSMEALGLMVRDVQGDESSIASTLITQLLVTARRLRAVRRTADSVTLLHRARDLAFEVMPGDPAFYVTQLASVLTGLTKAYEVLGRGTDMAASARAEWDLLVNVRDIDDLTSKARVASHLESRVSVLQDYVPRVELLAALSEAHQIRLTAATVSDEPLLAEIQAWRGLAHAYEALRCREEMLVARENAELAWRHLTKRGLDVYGEGLAEVLMFRANHLSEGDEQAIDILREVVSIRRSIVSRQPGRNSSAALAQALLSLGGKLQQTGYAEGAIRTTEEAVDIFRQLAEEHQGNELLRLAQALDILTTRLIRAHMSHRAAMATMDKVRIYRRLAAIDFSRYGKKLITALMESMNVFQMAGMRARVGSTAHEVIKISRRIQERPQHGDADPSKIYAGAGLALAKAGMYEDALSAFRNTVDIRRERVASGGLGEYAPELIRALGYLADVLSVMGRWRDALAPADEAYAICGNLLSELPRDRRHSHRRSDTEQFYACLVRLKYLLERLSRDHDAARKYREGLNILDLLARNGNRTAIRLANKDLPVYRPLDSLRAPWRAI
jgi:tetratricopeptide (TPR) repeat protein